MSNRLEPTGHALLFDGPNLPLRLIDQHRPNPAAGEILIRVEAATLCGSDLHTISGKRQVQVPTVLGHETIGRVEEIGPGPAPLLLDGRQVRIGQRVTWAVVAHCGNCLNCQRGFTQKCSKPVKYGHEPFLDSRKWTGGLATWNLLSPGTSLVELPADLPAGLATPASCATATIACALEAIEPLRDNTLLISGAGMLGLTAIVWAKKLGTSSITVIDPLPWRRNLAIELGANHALEPAGLDNLPKQIDAWLELSGSNSAWESGFDCLAVGARVALVGSVFPAPETSFSLEKVVRRIITIRGVHNYGPRHLEAAVKFLSALPPGHPLGKLPGPWFPLDRYQAALKDAERPEFLRVGFQMNPS